MTKIYIKKSAIVSNSDMIKNYRACRVKAEGLGKIFVLKRNHPDAVLFSIDEYEKHSESIEKLENNEKKEIAKNAEHLPKEKNETNHSN